MADSEIGEHRKAEQPAEFDKKSGTGTGTRLKFSALYQPFYRHHTIFVFH